MQTRAAVLWEPNTDWKIEDIELDPPKAGEVMLKLVGSGLCHSDDHLVTGDMVMPPEVQEELGIQQFPIIGGHEGAGEVVEVGPGVDNLEVGDHVVLGFIPSCGRCPSCARGKQNLCDLGAYLLAGRQVTDFTARHHHKETGQDLGIMCCIGTFGEYTTVGEASCIKIDKDIPLDKAALVGCGVTTGWGSANYAANVQAGETVVVIGNGGIGMNAIQGAKMAGAGMIIAVDTNDKKHEMAEKFGATHTVGSVQDALPMVMELTQGQMADKVIVTIGVGSGAIIQDAMALTTKGGTCVHTSVAPIAESEVTLNLFELTLSEKSLVGSIFGSANPRRDIPRLLSMYQNGQLMLDELITNTYDLDDINVGYDAMRSGDNIRGMVMYDHS
jgi:S-(hydroxymethyl)glutathione dehydrogenase/alcohol dehydrogenase